MSAVVSAIADAIGDVVEAVGDVVEDVVDLAEDVIDTVAENPLLIVCAVAAPFALGALAAEAGVVGALEVATAAEAVETGVAVLEATEAATAVASAEAAAATTVIEAGATVAEAATAATAVTEGSTVAEAVSAATGGVVEASPIVEAATTATSEVANTSAWDSLSNAAKNITQTIGETLAPEADPLVQKTIGQVAVNTATNDGDLSKGLQSTFMSLGTGFLGSEVADLTGSDMAGRAAANATRQLATTGNLDLTKLASGEVGKLVGNEVADETGSNLLGKAASSVTNSAIQGKDATTGLLNLGINEGVNAAFNTGSDLLTSAPKAETVDDITGGDKTADISDVTDTTKSADIDTVLDTTKDLDTVLDTDTSTDTVLDDTTPVGGLAAVTQTPTITTSDDTNIDDKSTDVVIPENLSDLTKVTSPTVEKGVDLTSKATDVTTDDELQKQIDAITAANENKGQQVVSVEDKIVSPEGLTTKPEELPVGGLNVIQQTQTEEPKVDPVTGEVKASTSSNIPLAGSGLATGLIKSNLTKSLSKSLAPTKPVGGLKTALKPVMPVKKQAAAPKMDISKLIPIAKAPVKPTAPKGNLTPVTNISGLTSLLKKKAG